MNIVIVGAGAVGLLFYQALYRCKNQLNVTLSLQQHTTKIPSFTFTNINDASSLIPINQVTNQQLASADILFICVKSYQVKSALQQNLKRLNKKAIIILCHNGMGAFESYIEGAENGTNKQVFTNPISQSVLSLLITHGSKKSTAQHVIHTGEGVGDLGLIYGKHDQTTFEHLTALLNTALPSITWHNNIQEKQWLKLAINTIINPITAVNNIPNGDVLLPQYQDQITQLLREFILVAKRKNVIFSYDDLLSTVKDVARKTAKNRSSMLSDIVNQQKTEIDYINGYIVKLAQQFNIATPYHQQLVEQVKALQQ